MRWWWGQKVPREVLGWESSCNGGEVVGSGKVTGSGMRWGGSQGRWWDRTGPWKGTGVKRGLWRMEEWGLWESCGIRGRKFP